MMDGQMECLPMAVEVPPPRSISAAATRTAFSMTTLPQVFATMLSTSRIGTPLRINEARVRVKRARQILCAIGPKIGSLILVRSQNSRPGLVLMENNHPYTHRPIDGRL